MNKRARTIPLVAVALASAFLVDISDAKDTKPDEPKIVSITAPIKVLPDGTAEIGDIEPLQGRLEDIVRSELLKETYAPATIDGRTVTSESYVSASVTLTPTADGQYSVETKYIRVGPRSLPEPFQFRKLVEQMDDRAGYVILDIRIGVDGRVTVLDSSRSSPASIQKTANIIAKKWRFSPTIADGVAVPIDTTVVILFNIDKAKERPKYECIFDSKSPRMRTQKYDCLMLVTIESTTFAGREIRIP